MIVSGRLHSTLCASLRVLGISLETQFSAQPQRTLRLRGERLSAIVQLKDSSDC
jgi:hypothetical protein